MKQIEVERVKRTIYIRKDFLDLCDSLGMDFSRFVENFLFLYLDGYSDIITKILKGKLKKNASKRTIKGYICNSESKLIDDVGNPSITCRLLESKRKKKYT